MKPQVRGLFCVFLLAVALAGALGASPRVGSASSTGLANGKFDLEDERHEPFGWSLEPKTSGYSVQIVKKGCRQSGCLHIIPPVEGSSTSAAVVQSFDPGETRGRYALVEYSVRLDPQFPRGRAQITFSQYRKGSPVPVLRRSVPVEQTRWESVRYRSIVVPDADRLAIAIQAVGGVAVFVDSISIKPDLKLKDADIEPARELAPEGLENLVAFTKLYAMLRFFHPSTGLRTLNWQENAVEGVREVEDARSPEDLAKRLRAMYRRSAPSVRILLAGEKYERPEDVQIPAGRPHVSVAVMKHVGFGLARGTDAMGSMVTEEFVGDPEQPRKEPEVAEVRLGASLTAMVPLQLLRDRTRAPQPLPSRFVHLPTSLPASLRGANDRSGRLASVVIAWSSLRYFHPYADLARPDWDAMLRKALQEAAAKGGDRQFRQTLQAMLAPLQDTFAEVLYPAPRRWLSNYRLEQVEDQVVVTGSDRFDEGRVGDVLETINGAALRDLKTPETNLRSGSTRACAEHRNTEFLLQSLIEDTNRLKFRQFPADAVLPPSSGRARGPFEEQTPGVFYVDLSRLTTRAFEMRVKELGPARGIVFDLRGGSLASPQILGYLSKTPLEGLQTSVPIVTRPDQFSYQRYGEIRVPVKVPHLEAKRAFLTGEKTRGQAEVLLEMVQRYGLGLVVGETSCGSVGETARIGLLGGFAIQFNGLRSRLEGGGEIHGHGIVPEVRIQRTRRGVAQGRDQVLEGAMAALDKP